MEPSPKKEYAPLALIWATLLREKLKSVFEDGKKTPWFSRLWSGFRGRP